MTDYLLPGNPLWFDGANEGNGAKRKPIMRNANAQVWGRRTRAEQHESDTR